MPLREFKCSRDHRVEVLLKRDEPDLESCPTCGRPVKRVTSATSFSLKGGGWAKDGYQRRP